MRLPIPAAPHAQKQQTGGFAPMGLAVSATGKSLLVLAVALAALALFWPSPDGAWKHQILGAKNSIVSEEPGRCPMGYKATSTEQLPAGHPPVQRTTQPSLPVPWELWHNGTIWPGMVRTCCTARCSGTPHRLLSRLSSPTAAATRPKAVCHCWHGGLWLQVQRSALWLLTDHALPCRTCLAQRHCWWTHSQA